MSPEKFGRYEVEKLLGKGSMGAVYKAWDPVLKRTLAIKVMTGAGSSDEDFVKRFFREAEATAGLNHLNIVALYDIGEQDGQPYIAIEYLEGEDLSSILRKKATIPFSTKVRLVIELCRGLDHAHNRGVIHRDIKPSNIHITPDGSVKIVDFGIAKLASSEMTATGILMGTPSYMSPEQVTGHSDLDGRSDLFSTGVIVYELITGKKPFEGTDFRSVMMAVCNAPHRPVHEVLPGCSDDLVSIVDRSLAKERKDRFQSAQEMEHTLHLFLQAIRSHFTTLEKETEDLLNQVTSIREELLTESNQELFDPALFETSESVDPDRTILSFSTQHDMTHDYGDLLRRHAALVNRQNRLKKLEKESGRLKKLLTEARSQVEGGDWEGGLANLEEILKWIPENSETRDLKQRCLENLEQKRAEEEEQKRIQEELLRARKELESGNAQGALQVVHRVLDREPKHAEALALQASAKETQEQTEKISGHLEEARLALKKGEHRSALDTIRRGLELAPEHPELLQLQEEVSRGLEQQEEAQRNLEQLAREITLQLKKAEQLLSESRHDDALEILEGIVRRDPGNEEALRLKQQAESALERKRRQLQAKEILVRAQTLERSKDYTASLEAAKEALEYDPDSVEIAAFINKIQPFYEAQKEEEERQEEILKGLRQARNLLRLWLVEAASRRLQSVLELDATSAEARQLLQEVEDRRISRRQLGKWAIPAAGLLLLVAVSLWVFRTWSTPPSTQYSAYQVQAGDTLENVSSRFSITGERLIELNQLENSSELVPRRVLHFDEPATDPGELVLEIVPWASIDSVVRSKDQTPVLKAQATTPLTLKLAPGQYIVTASNSALAEEKIVFETDVKAGSVRLENRQWPGFDLESELDAIFGANDEQVDQ